MIESLFVSIEWARNTLIVFFLEKKASNLVLFLFISFLKLVNFVFNIWARFKFFFSFRKSQFNCEEVKRACWVGNQRQKKEKDNDNSHWKTCRRQHIFLRNDVKHFDHHKNKAIDRGSDSIQLFFINLGRPYEQG